jgi:plasmid stabilization system protein ParE
VARIELAPEIIEDFERIVEHLQAHQVAGADARLDEILDAIDVLQQHPLIGRTAGNGLRELIVGRRSRGFVALYSYLPESETILVLAIRSQKEAGYRDD